jgi:voltage-gated potassium channel
MIDGRRLSRIIGAAGVASTEKEIARKVGVVFELPMLMAALGILLRWWGESSNVDIIYDSKYFDIFLWGLFVSESLLLSFLVNHPLRYLKENWLNLVIIVLGLPLLAGWDMDFAALRLLRMLIVFSLLVHVGSRVEKMLAQNALSATLLASAIVIVMSGVMMAVLEPGIESPWDGIWWAWVTVTTVGYGDIVPRPPQGRLFGGIIILMGIGLFSMITATFAAYFISRKEDEVLDEERSQYRRMGDMEERLYNLEGKVDEILAELRKK